MTWILVLLMSSLPLAVTLPPAEYDREPAVKYEVIETPWHKVDALCPGHEFERVLACARDFGPLGWTIVMPKRDGSLLGDDWKLLLRHEKGHINGWPRFHPGARLVGM